jgi:hypothetical protein
MDDRESAVWLLRKRLLALAREIRHWKAVSRPSAPPLFWTNHSQIRAFALIIDRFIRAISMDSRSPDFSAADARAHGKNVLALFRIWEFFRNKIVQRLDPHHAASLQLADEFAWACYRPAASQVYKEPPLVFLNGGFSPFILPRNREFSAEFVPHELIQNDELIEAMSRLPFPVIGIPWYQVATPWELPVIAHEVGHSIEGDLELGKELLQRIDAAVNNEARRARWKTWCSEIFADYYGCVAVGPSFVSNLAEFLAATNSIADDRYPPASIRLRLNTAFLGDEFSDFAAASQIRWANLFNVPADYQSYSDPDTAAVAAAFRTVEVRLPRFSAVDHKVARNLATTALAPEVIFGLHDVRIIVAALRIGYEAIVEKVESHQATMYTARLNQLAEVLRQSSKPDTRAFGWEADASKRKAAHLARSHDWL